MDNIIFAQCERCLQNYIPENIYSLENGDCVCVHCLTDEDIRAGEDAKLEDQLQDTKGRIIRAMQKLESARIWTGSVEDGQVDYQRLYESLLFSVKGTLRILNGEA